jgi:glutamine amidotransferase
VTDGPRIAVVDYGIGNLRSAEKALQHVGADARLTSDADEIAAADGVVVPGVGAFGGCADALRATGLDELVRSLAVAARDSEGVPFLGICVGMQLLYTGSDEDPDTPGLDVLPGRVVELDASVKRPQMQWNRLHIAEPDHWLWADLADDPWLYFVHTYAAEVGPSTAAVCEYGGKVAAAAAEGRLVATQFHPEKSGSNGLRILSNFTVACRR